MTDSAPPWTHKPLHELTPEEWESLCDGCAKCCLVQLQDEETDQLVFTDVACHLLDQSTCRCTDYSNRSQRVPECMTLNPENVATASEFAPPSCAYRLRYLDEPLPSWHPARSGDAASTISSGHSVAGRVISNQSVDEEALEERVVDWPLEWSE